MQPRLGVVSLRQLICFCVYFYTVLCFSTLPGLPPFHYNPHSDTSSQAILRIPYTSILSQSSTFIPKSKLYNFWLRLLSSLPIAVFQWPPPEPVHAQELSIVEHPGVCSVLMDSDDLQLDWCHCTGCEDEYTAGTRVFCEG